MRQKISPEEKRRKLRRQLSEGPLVRMPGAFIPLVAMEIERQGWDGVYLSGGALSASLGWPDIGLTTLGEVAHASANIARVTNLPLLVDADTGFGSELNVARTIMELEAAGAAGCHLEDQQNPKRCGHLDHKELVDVDQMCAKIAAATKARQDTNFLLIARTDARAVEGLPAAIARAKRYVDAGVDAIFPEALQDQSEFAAFREQLQVPLLANMTEFGKSPLLSCDQLSDLGYQIVIYPVSTLRLAMGAIRDGLGQLQRDQGQSAELVARMQTRVELYQLLDYEGYQQFDANISRIFTKKEE